MRETLVDPRSGRHAGERKGWDRCGVISVIAKGTFKAVKMEKSWDERFIYGLAKFWRRGEDRKLEVWANPLTLQG